MARADNTYSRIVAGMKVLLPLMALGLLSTLFLISRTIDPSGPVPTAPVDLEERARTLGVTRPSFAGVSDRGDRISVHAGFAWPDRDVPHFLNAERITGEIGLVGGAKVYLRAATARFDQAAMTVSLEGAVHVTTTTGYEVDTDRIDTRLDALFAQSPGPVTATGPPGEIEADRMVLQEAAGSRDAELLFTGNVKLIYRPGTEKEQNR